MWNGIAEVFSKSRSMPATAARCEFSFTKYPDNDENDYFTTATSFTLSVPKEKPRLKLVLARAKEG